MSRALTSRVVKLAYRRYDWALGEQRHGQALFMSGEKWAVYVVQEGRARLREIQISTKNERSALVTEGLMEGDRVLLFPGDKISDGTGVKTE